MADVAVCALTFRRPEGLARLLRGLGRLEVDGELAVRVVIVDNDPAASGRAVVDRARPAVRFPISYVVEARRGIAHGRNRAVAEALAWGAAFVAFIDDDEEPRPDWLVELLRVQRSTGADVVHGRVEPRFERPPPRWVLDGRFFERRRIPTGQTMTWATTSNVLVAAHVFDGDSPPFATQFALTGGEDTHFFMRAVRAGRTIVAADDAVVVELVPSTRATVGWLVRREYRRGNTLSLCLVDLDRSPRRRLRRAVHGLGSLVWGAVLAGTGVVRGRARVVRGLREAALGAGLLSGLAHVAYREYEVVHGG